MNTMTEKQYNFLNQLQNTFNTINNFTQVEHDDMSEILESNIDDMKRELEYNNMYNMVKYFMEGKTKVSAYDAIHYTGFQIIEIDDSKVFGFYEKENVKTFYLNEVISCHEKCKSCEEEEQENEDFERQDFNFEIDNRTFHSSDFMRIR